MNTTLNKTGYKKTKLGWIPMDWKAIKLADLVKPDRPIRYGIVQTGENIKDGIPCIRVVDLVNGQLDQDSMIKTSNEINNTYRKTIVQENEIIFALRGEIGKVVKITKREEGINITRGTARIAPKNEIDPNYLLWQIRSENVIRNIMLKVNGSALKEVPIGGLKKVLIPVENCIKKQQKTAKILTTWDRAIQKLESLIEKKQQLKKGLMQVLLTGEVRFKEFVKKEGYQETKLGRLPKDWEVVKLGQVSTFLDGKRKPIKSEDRAKMKGNYPYYGASGIIDYVNDYIFDEELILLGEDGENILSRNLPLAFKISGKNWVNNHAHVIKPNDDMAIGYLCEYLESLNYVKFNTGTAQPKLNKKVCLSINVIKPAFSEQQRIAQVFYIYDQGITKLENELKSLQKQKKGLMQVLLTGEKRVKLDK